MKAEPKLINTNSLPVMESFYTIQGEGAFSGQAAYFIRLSGCDVGCVWCDVKESWGIEPSQYSSMDRIVDEALKWPGEIVVITGGEPAMHSLEEITTKLINAGKRCHIETSGAHTLSGKWHWVCLSPKKFKKPLDSVYRYSHELKVVIFNKHDFKWAEEHASKVNKDCSLYLQPEWSKREEMMPLIVEYVKNNPQWRISLQTHKYLNIP